MKDSIMICILHSAMDKAHEKLKSKEGVIERLIEISRFYELAVMQLEGCLKFVHEETESYTLERGHEEVLSDLTKVRDRLQGRLEETAATILNKDRELTERLENELKLRQALELKDRELVSLRAKLEVERSKNEGLQEFILSNRLRCMDEGRVGEICELKSVEGQQVLNLKQKLEDGQMNITSGTRNVDHEYEMVDEERNWNIDEKKTEHMSLGVDGLKETFNLAFGTMQNAIFLSEVEATEQQWRWTIEKDAISILTKGFMRDFRERFELEVRKQENPIAFLDEIESDLMNETKSLSSELEPRSSENELQMDNIEGHDTSVPSSQTNLGGKISQGKGENPLPEDD
ncbi:hypothetical protein L1049_011583 [Liquidambar formosana]|uniref:Uncharacterized protein n=1 Tax=Liquidambar formosana TaxID=63359 RepID=A0AAP0WY78_LIQFO